MKKRIARITVKPNVPRLTACVQALTDPIFALGYALELDEHKLTHGVIRFDVYA